MTFGTDTSEGTPSGDFPLSNAEVHKLACANCGTPLSTNYGKTALICTYCGQRHRFLEPPEDAGDTSHAIGD
ncbi:MAG: hypothetical protein JXX14_01170, partial [Deltaproteobacteria bacterium]|nr:hypothetical protein [Deltaproteobacteria bacterium]